MNKIKKLGVKKSGSWVAKLEGQGVVEYYYKEKT